MVALNKKVSISYSRSIGDFLKIRRTFKPAPSSIYVIPISKVRKIEEFETMCYRCGLRITFYIADDLPRPFPIGCARCKKTFWY